MLGLSDSGRGENGKKKKEKKANANKPQRGPDDNYADAGTLPRRNCDSPSRSNGLFLLRLDDSATLHWRPMRSFCDIRAAAPEPLYPYTRGIAAFPPARVLGSHGCVVEHIHRNPRRDVGRWGGWAPVCGPRTRMQGKSGSAVALTPPRRCCHTCHGHKRQSLKAKMDGIDDTRPLNRAAEVEHVSHYARPLP